MSELSASVVCAARSPDLLGQVSDCCRTGPVVVVDISTLEARCLFCERYARNGLLFRNRKGDHHGEGQRIGKAVEESAERGREDVAVAPVEQARKIEGRLHPR